MIALYISIVLFIACLLAIGFLLLIGAITSARPGPGGYNTGVYVYDKPRSSADIQRARIEINQAMLDAANYQAILDADDEAQRQAAREQQAAEFAKRTADLREWKRRGSAELFFGRAVVIGHPDDGRES